MSYVRTCDGVGLAACDLSGSGIEGTLLFFGRCFRKQASTYGGSDLSNNLRGASPEPKAIGGR